VATEENLSMEEAKLKVVTSEDADLARLYREAYGDIKADKEQDYDEADRIDARYSYLKDKYGL
jgi:hypothetical protein